MWTGWDYLGEAGIGSWEYDGPYLGRFFKPYPQLTAGTGVFDITGLPSVIAYIAQAAWGNLPGPVISVRPPHLHNKRVRRSPWRRTNAIPSWSWHGCEGMTAVLEIISLDNEVEVILNGRSLGRRTNSVANNYTTSFTTRYEPGQVTAIGFSNIDGKRTEISRTTIRSARETQLRISPEVSLITADVQTLIYINVELADSDGIVEFHDDDTVNVTVTGPATLLGFGSGATSTTERFDSGVHSTFQGTALIALRSQGQAGIIMVSAESERHGSARCSIDAK